LKVSASLPSEDVDFLDAYGRANGFRSRSSVLHFAITLLQGAQLTSSYEAAWAEWKGTPDSADWAAASVHPIPDPRQLMRRGEIRMVELGAGSPVATGTPGQRVRRPAVIVSNDGANETARRLGHGVVTIVPVTSNVERIYPFQTHLRAAYTGLTHDSKAQAEQIRWIDVADVGERVGVVPLAVMMALGDALRLHLSL
jgi:mRNA interferase MazF